ncbi:MAG: ParB/RepB/Spo0J family partition protein [Treponema sp.]|nr:ParB/RepB/Spo0J family partition protein [Treponema sp.]
MSRRIGLGRGLDALLSEDDGDFSVEAEPEKSLGDKAGGQIPRGLLAAALPISGDPAARAEVAQIPVDMLVASPGQPRKNFDEAELRELADSIARHGVIQPAIVASRGDGTYAIIAGERRTRAARLAGLETVPCIVRDYNDQKRLEVSLIENVQRSDLNPIEEAAAYKNLMDFSGLSQEELAARVGKNRSTVANALRLLRLPGDMQKSLESGALTPGHAKALLSVAEPEPRQRLFVEILRAGLSVRDAERRAAELGEARPEPPAREKPAQARPAEIEEIEERLIDRLGTKVRVEGSLNRGRIFIEYFSMEDLGRLHEIICED